MSKLSKEEIYAVVDHYKESGDQNPIAIFGAGEIGHNAVAYCEEKGIVVSCIADNNSNLWGTRLNGIEIVPPDALKNGNVPLILIASNFYNEMARQLDEYGLYRYLSYFLFRGRYELSAQSGPEVRSVERACNWILQNQQVNGGVSVYHGAANEYPEVTGYIIPTMLQFGFQDEALKMANYLVSEANEDGSFNAAGTQRMYLFDTAQALRGLNAVSKVTDQYDRLREKTAEFLFSVLEQNGGVFPKSYEDDPEVPEAIMLFALPPMMEYAQSLKQENKISLVHQSVKQYLNNPQVLSQKSLTHFLAYQIDGLIDLGYPDAVKDIMSRLLVSQRPDGSIPAYEGVDWVCITGCSQLAICLYKLGNREPADQLMAWVEQNMEASGGFLGSVGPGAKYYADRELSWAVKFYLDAYKRMIRAHFDYEFSVVAPTEIDPDDVEVLAIADALSGSQHVLEVGCGKGRILKRLHERFPDCELEGIDISPNMLSFAPDFVKTTVGEIEFLPYEDDTFDLVYTVECIEHSVHMRAAVRELIRVCKPGGTVIIIDKQLSNWGRLVTPSWERWPDRLGLEGLLKKGCNMVCSSQLRPKGYDDRDDLFVKWEGKKRGQNNKAEPKTVFFGAGGIGASGLRFAMRSGMHVDFFVDNNRNLWGGDIDGVPIYSPEVLRDKKKYTIIVTVGYEYYSEIREQLSEMNYAEGIDFWEFRKALEPGFDEFGMVSGVTDFSPELEVVKTLAKNRLCLDADNQSIYRFINSDLHLDFLEIFRRCKDARLFDRYLVRTELAEQMASESYPLCFRHEYIPLFSYALEWSPKMFFDYTLFMIDFLADLDRAGLGWGDAHAFNATFNCGKFLFFDFDAVLIGKTHCYRIQEFINAHILILLLMSKNQLKKAYLYLNNPDPGIMLSIKDISGYLTPEELNGYHVMAQSCHEHAMAGDIQTCSALMKEYVLNISLSQIFNSVWNGYQNELYETTDIKDWSDKQKAVIEMVRSAKPKTLLDLAGNMGWYEFILSNEVERCIVADLDYSCVDFVYQKVAQQKVKNVYPVYLNLVTPTPSYYKDTLIGDTAIIPWRKSAIERFKSEMVLALAVTHHLAFSQQLSFEEIIGQFALYTSKWLIIEFIERDDSVVAPAVKKPDFDWYTQDNFERALTARFCIISSAHSEPTRILYLCAKRDNER